MVRRCRVWSAALPRRRYCSMLSRARGLHPRRCRARPRARFSPQAINCRRRCNALASMAQARRSSRRASCSRLTARGSRWPPAASRDPVALKITGGRAPLTVMVNGVPLAAQNGRGTLFFQPDGPGFVRLTVMDARGATDSVTVGCNSARMTEQRLGPIVRQKLRISGHR